MAAISSRAVEVLQIWQKIDHSRRFGIKPGLERMRTLMRSLSHPERSFKTIHIAGTNGKGSLVSLLSACFETAGISCGAYTSPHLLNPLERIKIGLKDLGEDAFISAWQELEPALEGVCASYFEQLTALAFVAFRQQRVNWVLLECGMGGRWDATNVVDSEVAVITSVSLDHIGILGQNCAEIARDKAGIARRGKPLVAGPCDPSATKAIEEEAAKAGAQLVQIMAAPEFENCSPATSGNVKAAQLARTCIAACPVELNLQEPVCWSNSLQARFQILQTQPLIILDVAHNSAAVSALCSDIERLYSGIEFTLLYTGMQDKDHASMLAHLSKLSSTLLLADLPHKRLAECATLQGIWYQQTCRKAQILNVAQLEKLRFKSTAKPLLICGGFVLAAWWLGAEELPPGL